MKRVLSLSVALIFFATSSSALARSAEAVIRGGGAIDGGVYDASAETRFRTA
jgi:hypothetical protein